MKISLKFKTIIAALFITLGLASCSKIDGDQTPIQISGLSLIHASPTIEKLDVYVDNTRANVEDFAFGAKIDYLNAYSGDRNLTVTKKGLTTKLTSKLLKLESGLGYSVFVVDKFETVDLLMLQDNLAKPAAGKAKIRFVNLSPDAGALNLEVVGKTPDLIDNKAFKEYSEFVAIDPAEKVSFNIKNKTSGAVETTLVDIKIEDGKIYTLYAKGLKATADATKFGAAIFTHK
ncbi:DUF4397 domain-containing protein [Pedobacter polaris]|uniref:DUF4397 domain-containing protein n=1 Tax=Pedobacter polaris TaxID=2571273 RepID=A0A4U1CYJ3_9SPHI|nr:DUF4397 domain-containing protein [Pedobacter polaris]TKC12709.1 DUF4397 domain-containing protein [Pedobacter polaris]